MCLQFSVDNYLLQVLGWALTEDGDCLQSLVNTPSLKTNSFNVHSSVSDIVTKEVSIALHYITLHYITLHYITLHYITLHYITLHSSPYPIAEQSGLPRI